MKKISIFFAVFLLPLLSMAHGYWIEVKSNNKMGQSVQIQLFFGEFASQMTEKGKTLDKMDDIKVCVIDEKGNKTDVLMKQTETHWEGDFTPSSNGVYQVLGINDTRGVQDWKKHNLGITRPIQYIRTTFIVGDEKNVQSQFQPLDVVAQKNGEAYLLTAVKANIPFQKTKLSIINPEGWTNVKYTNQNGEASFKPNMKGIYMVELEWIDKTEGVYKEVKYESIRHKCNMTVAIN